MANLTTIEIETMTALKKFCQEMVDNKKPNWERMRNETAKECLMTLMPTLQEQIRESIEILNSRPGKIDVLEVGRVAQEVCNAAADLSVLMADTLVNKLRTSKLSN